MNVQVRQAAQIVWEYHLLGHELAPADLLFVLGSHDLRVAEHAADLFHRGLAPRVVLSGGFGVRQASPWAKSEAEMFADVMRSRGVPETALLLEPRSTNTGENVRFTRELLAARGLAVQSVIAVQKPYMERRTFATIRRQWPEVALLVSSPPLGFAAYCNGAIPARDVIEFMVGDLQRIIEYPKLGFMIPQEVPAPVRVAFDQLVAAGYTRHLIKPSP
ncbi:MAG: YdcF family protein [Limisphaerales bacterium]